MHIIPDKTPQEFPSQPEMQAAERVNPSYRRSNTAFRVTLQLFFAIAIEVPSAG